MKTTTNAEQLATAYRTLVAHGITRVTLCDGKKARIECADAAEAARVAVLTGGQVAKPSVNVKPNTVVL